MGSGEINCCLVYGTHRTNLPPPLGEVARFGEPERVFYNT